MTRRRLALFILIGIVVLLAALWLARAVIAARIAQGYFRDHGITASVEIGDFGLSGVAGRFALGTAAAPDISADRIELRFDPLHFLPRVVEVRLVRPVIRARIDTSGTVTLPSLQNWIASLQEQQGQSRWVADDLAVSLTDARALLATPGGAVEIGGDLKLVKNLPVSARLAVKPARLAWQGTQIDLLAASLVYGQDRVTAALSGTLQKAGMTVRDGEARLDAAGLSWSLANAMPAGRAGEVRIRVSASSITVPQKIEKPDLDATLRNLVFSSSRLSADVEVIANLGVETGSLSALHDPMLARAIARNLSRIAITAKGHVARQDGKTRFALTAPLMMRGAKGGQLRLSSASLTAAADTMTGTLDATLSGPALPDAKVALRDITWSRDALSASANVSARFSYAMLRGADIAAEGPLSWQAGRFAFRPMSCIRAALAAFHPGASDLAKSVRAAICPQDNRALLEGDASDWSFNATAREASATLPLSNTKLDQGAALLAFTGKNSAILGAVTVNTARMSDLAATPRFQPVFGNGTVTLADWAWHGKIAFADGKKKKLGETVFQHVMATGEGAAHIAAPGLVFAADGLQPTDISPLLAALRHAEGKAEFTGDIAWTRQGLTSRGTLGLDTLDFITPLGKAHAIKTSIAFTSLLPPVTAPDQQLTITRIDWTLPFTAVDLHFSTGDGLFRLDKLDVNFAQGHAATGGLAIRLDDPGHIAGAVRFDGVALDQLIAASNLGSKIQLAGKMSGRIPFTVSPEGFRIQDGHIAADGPGRLSINRALWAQGDAALASNAVQDFAYQAMENLAFDTMSADLNSIAGGRLQIVFKIKGKSDPPGRQTADIAISDIINGTALYKPIPLPSGTPIDLTLDTSLNFDELLKSYSLTWSQSTAPGAKSQ